MPFQLQDELPGGSKTAEDEEVGLVTSALAGVYTGLWNIPKGFFSLGAELMVGKLQKQVWVLQELE